MKFAEQLISHFSRSGPAVSLLEQLGREPLVRAKGLVGALRSLLLASLFEHLDRQVLYVCLKKDDAEEIKEEVQQLLCPEQVSYFPAAVFARQGFAQMNIDSFKERQAALEALASPAPRVVVSDVTGLLRRLPGPDEYHKQKVVLRVGAKVDFEETIERLVDLGFQRERRVEFPGEMCVRGGIIDLFPRSGDTPYRVEFWDDEVESLRSFDPESQRSVETQEEVVLYSQDVHEGGAEVPMPGSANLLDYLADDALLVLDDTDLLRKLLQQKVAGATDDADATAIAAETAEKALAAVGSFRRLELPALGGSPNGLIDFAGKAPTSFGGNLQAFRDHLEKLSLPERNPGAGSPQVFYSCENDLQVERLRTIFADEGIPLERLFLTALNLHRGFVFPAGQLVVYTDHEFYGRAKRLRLPKKRFKGIAPRELKHLNVGDYIVHVDYGIGLFRGLEKISVNGRERECLKIEYRDKDLVYVRIERMDRVNKYSSSEGAPARLNKLGSPEWQRVKSRTKKKLKDIAGDLIAIYALRKSRAGFAFAGDNLWQRELEASFPYEDTPDQILATAEVKKDMESPRPMDRLICGDVGFGKTEIAVRAAFKAAVNSKQVAILVPTTILAYQHFNTFRERLGRFPVRVEMLSRFRTRPEQKAILQDLAAGKVDILIGTHRLLSKDVRFRDLGLLVVDEEHRFGVTHKERLKQLRATIDVLTLTATPIPRTLHFSLLGARDMTHITTPPRDRLPIMTEILPFNGPYIREVVLREFERGGQVFFVHNRVRSIERVARMLADLVPEADIAVAHGQLTEKALEKVMVEFVDKRYHILVSTMIIESGLDMPNVNTIIVNRADMLGLAQLYQLRGRVGRSYQRAYAYLIIPPIEVLSPDALKRLRAIEEFSEIGSGSQLALRDLEIRGAGNLLGAEQTGFIDTLGFDLYNKVLDEAVRELKEERLEEESGAPVVETTIEADFDAYLPEEYVSAGPERVDIYRRLTAAATPGDVDEVADELRDRFGRLPQEVEHLLCFVKIRLVGQSVGLRRIAITEAEMRADFAAETVAAAGEHFNEWLGSMVTNVQIPFEFYQENSLGMRLSIPADEPAKMQYVSNFLLGLLPAK